MNSSNNCDEKKDLDKNDLETIASHLNGTYGLKSRKNVGHVPLDRFYIVYIILIIHGIGTLIPWNMFITSRSYYTDYKLNVTLSDPAENDTLHHLRKNFLSYVGFSAQLPNVICQIINLVVHKSGKDLKFRIVGSILIELAVIAFTIGLVILDSSSWPITFFYVTIISVTIVYMASGVYQNSIYGLAAHFPMIYTNGVVIGSNISGTLTSIINIISIAISPNPQIAASIYFAIAFVLLLICLVSYLFLPFNNFYSYWDNENKAHILSKVETKPLHLGHIFSTIWLQCFNIFSLFCVTLSLFPSVIANIESTDNAFNLPTIYFSPVICYLLFNVAAMIGNFLPSLLWHPGIKYLWIAVILRFAFIPFFLFCNFNPSTRVWPVIFNSDYYLFFGCLILGLTSGYFSSLIMMESPKIVKEKEYSSIAGMMTALFLVVGIFVGINASFLLIWLVEQPFF